MSLGLLGGIGLLGGLPNQQQAFSDRDLMRQQLMTARSSSNFWIDNSAPKTDAVNVRPKGLRAELQADVDDWLPNKRELAK